MRIDSHGEAVPAIAESVDISTDLKTYTFNLRPASWSDSTPVTAKDFEETWKSVLDPSFPAPQAHQFYLIKGAKAYKEGKSSVDDVGIKSPQLHQLVVELENPTPYFLKIVSTYFYLPVAPAMRLSKDNENSQVISNGPSILKNWKHNNELILVKSSLLGYQSALSRSDCTYFS